MKKIIEENYSGGNTGTKNIFPPIFAHKKSGEIFFDFGSRESVCAVLGSICAEKCTFFT